MDKHTEDILTARIKELRRLLAVCVSRLGGHVVITSDDDDAQGRPELVINECFSGVVELVSQRASG